MFFRFFIDRPIFASVMSIVVTLAGAVALSTLPVTQYPEITPPTVEVSAVYPGANAQVVADTVAAPIEQQVNGVEAMVYMTSHSTNDGTYRLTVTFRPGTDLDLAQVMVQNRVALAQPILPELVRRRGVTVKKKSSSTLMIVNLFSPDGSRDDLYLSNYATIQLRDELARLAGVGDISFLGQRDYSMRVWLDPDRLAVRGLTAADVVQAIEQQNAQVAAGQIGQPPIAAGQVFQYTMNTLGRLSDQEQFGRMIVRAEAGGRMVRLEDVARVELGALAYDQICTLNGQPTVALAVYQLPGTNALETARDVRRRMDELKRRFPAGVDYAIVYDTTPFIEESVREVFVALRDAVWLVAGVMLVFLRGWRAAVIPLVAVPVAIIGTFAAMAAAQFSLNTLTLFGLVLAIGIVVDDAIVVVEAIERQLELGLDPRAAALQAMSEVAGPVVAVGLVLSAVFVPCAFISGIVGQFYRQFALTIAISTVISTFNSLTLSPALAVLLLKPRTDHGAGVLPRWSFALLAAVLAGWWLPAWLSAHGLGAGLAGGLEGAGQGELPGGLNGGGWWGLERLWGGAVPLRPLLVRLGLLTGAAGGGWLLGPLLDRLCGAVFDRFHQLFEWLSALYARCVGGLLRVTPVGLLVYAVLLWSTWRLFQATPAGFIPRQDKGYLLVDVRLPDSAAVDRTAQVLRELEQFVARVPGVRHTLAISGTSALLSANASNFGTLYVLLDPFEERRSPERGAGAIAEVLQEHCEQATLPAVVHVLAPPPIDGLGVAGGVKRILEDRGNLGRGELARSTRTLVDAATSSAELQGVFSSLSADATWLSLEIDRTAAKSLGLSLADVYSTLQICFGSLYINDFNRFGRTWQVNVQADARFRRQVSDLTRLRLRNRHGEMVPLGSVLTVRETTGPALLLRYNLYPAVAVQADAAPGVSSGQALARLEELSHQALVPSMRAEWTEQAFFQQAAGRTAVAALGLAVLLVFLVLAAQYESWSLPLAVILVVPMCLLSSLAGVRWAKLDLNVFTQIGFVVLVGLACKNAILIVEYARARRAAGDGVREALQTACRLRLRPIVMTSLAFLLGVVPLLVGRGAGAEMRYTLGVAVFAGMLGVTLFGLVFTPLFFHAIDWVVGGRGAREEWGENGANPAPVPPGT